MAVIAAFKYLNKYPVQNELNLLLFVVASELRTRINGWKAKGEKL